MKILDKIKNAFIIIGTVACGVCVWLWNRCRKASEKVKTMESAAVLRDEAEKKVEAVNASTAERFKTVTENVTVVSPSKQDKGEVITTITDEENTPSDPGSIYKGVTGKIYNDIMGLNNEN